MRRLLLLVVLAAVAVTAHAGTARADHEETERRLKTAGIDPALREQIHEAIDRAVGFLLAHQTPGGGFHEGGSAPSLQVGVTTLSAFALRHAGTPPARAGAAKSLARLFPDESTTPDVLEGSVYEAGLALLLLHADRSGEAHTRRLAARLAAGQDRQSGWWHYLTGPVLGARHSGSGAWSGIPRYVNLSTTQFAALGLWAAGRSDTASHAVVWRRHLEALLDLQSPDGSWPYEARTWQQTFPSPTGIAGFTYPTGTYMGLANLVLAEAALGTDDPFVRVRAAALRTARERASEALYRHARWTLRGHPGTQYPLYALYALEKACVFLGVERLEDVPWYREGAERLLAAQGADGGWSPQAWHRGRPLPADRSELAESAFGLLFLLRTSETTRPITPSAVDTPKQGEVTPGGQAPIPRAPDAPPSVGAPSARVPLGAAWALLARLQGLLSDSLAENADLLAALADIAAAAGRLAPDPGAEVAFGERVLRWRVEVEEALLESFALRRPGPGRERNLRGPVNQRAAELLARAGRGVSGRMRAVLERVHLGDEPQAEAPVLGAAFDALAVQGEPASATWLVERVLDTDQRWERVRRTERVLRALARFEGLPGTVRRDAFERLLRSFEGVEAAHRLFLFSSNANSLPPGMSKLVQRNTLYAWEWLRYDAVFALHALTGDTPDRAVLRDPSGERVFTLKAARAWFRDHEGPGLEVWR